MDAAPQHAFHPGRPDRRVHRQQDRPPQPAHPRLQRVRSSPCCCSLLRRPRPPDSSFSTSSSQIPRHRPNDRLRVRQGRQDCPALHRRASRCPPPVSPACVSTCALTPSLTRRAPQLYGIMQSMGNLGPGNMEGLISVESYPTAIRGTCYGFSAAVGKAGAAIGTQVRLPPPRSAVLRPDADASPSSPPQAFTPIQNNLGKRWTFIVAAICGLVGIALAYFFVEGQSSALPSARLLATVPTSDPRLLRAYRQDGRRPRQGGRGLAPVPRQPGLAGRDGRRQRGASPGRGRRHRYQAHLLRRASSVPPLSSLKAACRPTLLLRAPARFSRALDAILALLDLSAAKRSHRDRRRERGLRTYWESVRAGRMQEFWFERTGAKTGANGKKE